MPAPQLPVRPSNEPIVGMGPRAEGELLGAPNGEILANEHLSTGDGSEGGHERREVPDAAAPDEQPQQGDAEDLLQPTHDNDEAEEDVEPKRFAPSPTLPSAAEIDEHRICHFPFRSWCPHCVAGRALGERRDIAPLAGSVADI